MAAVMPLGIVAFAAGPAAAATPSPILSYDFTAATAAGSALAAGASIADTAGSHPGTVRGTGGVSVARPRGGTDRLLKLPGGSAGSAAAFVEITPGLTTSSTTDVTMSAWMKWNGDQSCASRRARPSRLPFDTRSANLFAGSLTAATFTDVNGARIQGTVTADYAARSCG